MSADPRGPERKITHVEESCGPTKLTLSCGHVRGATNHFHYRTGDRFHCLTCLEEIEAREHA
jgi:hypothetical protein